MNPKLIALTGDTLIAEKLEAYFRKIESQLPGAEDLGLLDMAQSIELSNQFRSFHPIVRDLKGVILDDPGTSNHHVFLGQLPLDGAVLHLSHDGSNRIVFDGIESFIEAANCAADDAMEIEDKHPEHAWIAEDQARLRDLIAALRSSTDGEGILIALLPSLKLSDVDFLSTLATDESFYVAEAVCNEIARRPTADLLPVAELGEQHPHSVVRDAAAKAKERISAL